VGCARDQTGAGRRGASRLPRAASPGRKLPLDPLRTSPGAASRPYRPHLPRDGDRRRSFPRLAGYDRAPDRESVQQGSSRPSTLNKSRRVVRPRTEARRDLELARRRSRPRHRQVQAGQALRGTPPRRKPSACPRQDPRQLERSDLRRRQPRDREGLHAGMDRFEPVADPALHARELRAAHQDPVDPRHRCRPVANLDAGAAEPLLRRSAGVRSPPGEQGRRPVTAHRQVHPHDRAACSEGCVVMEPGDEERRRRRGSAVTLRCRAPAIRRGQRRSCGRFSIVMEVAGSMPRRRSQP
jgi:hypothetical protein